MLTRHRLVALVLVGVAGCGSGGDQRADAGGDATVDGGDGGERVTIVPPTTHVSDQETRAALQAYDPKLGVLRFARETPVLASLKPGDVLVSEPSSAAPAGYLRKVVSVRRAGGEVVLETMQANLTDAVSQGELHARAALTADDVLKTEILVEGVTLEPASADGTSPDGGAMLDEDQRAVGVGESYRFDLRFNHVFMPRAGAGARGQVSVDGWVHFSAGYGVDVGISWCFELPPVCVDSFEAKVGFEQSSGLRISGNAEGALGDDVRIAVQYYKPTTFWIGPIPVVIVPRMDVFLTASGQVEAKFDFQADQAAVAQIGARWTNGGGWRDISGFDLTGEVPPPTFSGVVKPRTAARASMGLKLYDIAGPELALEAGLELDGHIPRNPIWMLSGYLSGTLTFKVELPIIGTLAEHVTKLFDTTRELGRSSNATPTLDLTANARPSPNVFPAGSPRTVDLRVPVDLRPGCPGVLGGGFYFVASDVEDGCPTVTVSSDRDGALPGIFTFVTTGRRTLTVRARDAQGASVTRTFPLVVVNTAPSVTLQGAGTPRQGEPFAIAALISDRNEADPAKLCARTVWTVEAPDVAAAATGCLQTVTFGTTGKRVVRVTTTDGDDGATSQMLMLDVLEPPANPYPRFTSASLGSRELKASGGADFCVVRTVPVGSPIDLTQKGCEIVATPGQPAPNRYFIGTAVENPAGEALTYQWTLEATTVGSVRQLYASGAQASNVFELHDVYNSSFRTEPCSVTLKINAPDPARSKGPITVWTGSCGFNGVRLN